MSIKVKGNLARLILSVARPQDFNGFTMGVKNFGSHLMVEPIYLRGWMKIAMTPEAFRKEAYEQWVTRCLSYQ